VKYGFWAGCPIGWAARHFFWPRMPSPGPCTWRSGALRVRYFCIVTRHFMSATEPASIKALYPI